MSTQHWERLGAASGIVAAILFGVSFIIFLGNDPTDLPDVLHAGDYAEFGREHQEALKERSGLGPVRRLRRVADGGEHRADRDRREADHRAQALTRGSVRSEHAWAGAVSAPARRLLPLATAAGAPERGVPERGVPARGAAAPRRR